MQIGEQIHELEECDIELLHIDIMDGEFVPSISFGMPVIKSIRKITDMFFDVHLMVNEPVRYVEDFAKCGADLLTVHYVACKDVRESLEKVRKLDNIRKESKSDFLIEIDGGVNIENAKEIAENGVDWIVAGTAVFGGDIKENIRKLKGEF